MQYEVTITFDIPCTRYGAPAMDPSGVLSYIRDEINCGRGSMHPDDGIQGVTFRCSRVRKAGIKPGEGRRIDQEAATLADEPTEPHELATEIAALRAQRDTLLGALRNIRSASAEAIGWTPQPQQKETSE